MSEQTWFEKILADLEGDPYYECEKKLFLLKREFIKAGERITKLENILIDYGYHRRTCLADQGRQCDCGFDKIMQPILEGRGVRRSDGRQ